jgi:hypothetical protein
MAAALLGMFVIGSVLLGELGRRDTDPAYERTAALAAASLTDDDKGHALFTTAELVPGSVVTNCLEIIYGGPATPATVRLAAFDVSGTLAPSLSVRVLAGTGGRFGDCTGFTGTAVYEGSLDGLAAPAAGSTVPSGVDTGWTPVSGDARTYQITVTVAPNVAQGVSCTATLRWMLVDDTPDPVRSTRVPTAPEAPAPEAPAAAVPAQPVPVSAAPALPAAPSAVPSPARTRAQARRKGGGTADPTTVAGVLDLARNVGGGVATVAKLTARHGGIIGGWVIVLVVFMALQNRIDGRDPKLALAPLRPEPYLSFDDDLPSGPAS